MKTKRRTKRRVFENIRAAAGGTGMSLYELEDMRNAGMSGFRSGRVYMDELAIAALHAAVERVQSAIGKLRGTCLTFGKNEIPNYWKMFELIDETLLPAANKAKQLSGLDKARDEEQEDESAGEN